MTKHPVALVILDGFGCREEDNFNAVNQAHTPNFDRYWHQYPHAYMEASGEAVGLPEGQIGNSEVGHTNIGAGRVVYQSITRINKAIKEGNLAYNAAIKKTFNHVKTHDSALHFFGLVSNGGVHSHQSHLYALIIEAKKAGVEKIYIHAATDGRDVAPNSGKDYIEALEHFLADSGVGEIATITGRYYSMDRDHRWERVKKAYDAIIHGEGKQATDAVKAVQESYSQEIYDEFIEPIILTKGNLPVATIEDNDAVLFFNFRSDRVRQLSHALVDQNFDEFERGVRPQNLQFTTMMDYGDHLSSDVVFPQENLTNVIGEVIADHGLTQLRIAETEKFPHVTFFMNGGREEKFSGEERLLVPSPKVATYDLKPEMSVYEIGDALVSEIKKGVFDLIILNFANPDMVGHSGKLEPTIKAVEAMDENLGKVVDTLLEHNGEAIIFADHGNAETLADEAGNPHTAHTTVKVPVIVTREGVTLRNVTALSDVAPTALDLLNIEQPKEMTGQSIIK